MYISRIRLEKLRCFEEFEVELGTTGKSLLILGENGGGKTTILRSLGMGICDHSSAASLFRELQGEFVRRYPGEKEVETGRIGSVEVDLIDPETDEKYQILTEIESLETFERVKRLDGLHKLPEAVPVDEMDFPWQKMFVSGYGAGSRTHGSADYRHYLAVDAVYPIFNYEVQLQNPELSIRRLKDAAEASTDDPAEASERRDRVLAATTHLLSDLLGLGDDDSIELDSTGIVVHGRWGKSELGELGDGYQATVTWVLDLISWWFLYHLAIHKDDTWLDFNSKDITGVVIIDEIEQHLHPRWQQTIIEQLITWFPKVQFIFTTHSPLCVVGTTAVNEEKLKTVVLLPDGAKVKGQSIPPPLGMRADQVLTGLYFSLDTASDSRIKKQVERYAYLATSTSRSAQEETEFSNLQTKLDEILGSEESEFESTIASAVRTVLSQQAATISESAVNYEVIRQLRELGSQ